MHNRVLLITSNNKIESFHNIKSLDSAQAIINRRGKSYYNSGGERVTRFREGIYYDSDCKKHQLRV